MTGNHRSYEYNSTCFVALCSNRAQPTSNVRRGFAGSFLRVSGAGGFLSHVCQHSFRRSSSTLAAAPTEPLKNDDRFFNRLSLRPEFRKLFADVPVCDGGVPPVMVGFSWRVRCLPSLLAVAEVLHSLLSGKVRRSSPVD